MILLNILLLNALCQENDDKKIFEDIYSKMHLLPFENRLIFGNNRTCIYDYEISELIKSKYYNERIYFCLYDDTVYLLANKTDFIELFKIDNINEKFFYDFNIYINETNDIDCIITYSNRQNQIIFNHYQISIKDKYNYNINITTYFFEVPATLSRGINCHKLHSNNRLICFYSYINQSFYASNFDISNHFKDIITDYYTSCKDINYSNDGETIIRGAFIKDKNQYCVCRIENSFIQCIIYNYMNDSFTDNCIDGIKNIPCNLKEQISSYYFQENHEILLTCKTYDGNYQTYYYNENNDNFKQNNDCDLNAYDLDKKNCLFYFFTFDKNNHSYELITNWTNLTSEIPSCIIHSGSNKTYDIITRPIPSESIHNNLVSSTIWYLQPHI